MNSLKSDLQISLSIFLLSFLFSTCSTCFGQLTGMTASPTTVFLTTAVQDSNFCYVTITGIDANDIIAARVSSSGIPTTGITAEITKRSLPQKATLKPTPESIVIKIKPTTKLKSGTYALEINLKKVWQKAGVEIRLNEKYTIATTTAIKPGMTTYTQVVNAYQSSNYMLAEKIPAANERIIFDEQPVFSSTHSNYPSPFIKDYFPKKIGAKGGTLILVGVNLDSIVQISIGTTVLSLLKKQTIMLDTMRFIYNLPKQALSGDLKILYRIKPGPTLLSIDDKLESNYRIADEWSEMIPKVTLLRYSYFNNYPAMYNCQEFVYTFRFENIPGNFVNKNDDILSRHYQDFVEKFTQINAHETQGEKKLFYGNTFDFIVDGKSLNARFDGFDFFIHPKKDGTASRPTVKLTYPFQLTDPVDYKLENTFALKSKFGFVRTSAWGQTDGTSDMSAIGGKKVAVGLVEDANDLAFVIASGPIGTEGVWKSNAITLKDGWVITKLEFSIRKSEPQGDSKVFALAPLSGNLDPENLGRGFDPFLYPQSTIPYNEFNSNEHFTMMYIDPKVEGCDGDIYLDVSKKSTTWMLRPIVVNLYAEATVLNDHVIVFTLESISLKGPANRDPMEAFEFGTSVVNGTLNWEIIQNCNGYDLIPVHVLQPY